MAEQTKTDEALEQIKVALRDPNSHLRLVRTESTVPTSTVQHLRYEMAGWHEQGRRWVLEQR